MRRAFALGSVAVIAAVLAGLPLGLASAAPADRALDVGLGAPAASIAYGSTSRMLAAERALEKRRAALKAHVHDMPDLTQTDPELGLPGGGGSYCGPVAVSNSLMWLSEHGYQGLAPAGDDDHARQLELVRRLGSRRYMATGANSGTGAAAVLEGLARYMKDAGFGFHRLQYQGWRAHPAKYSGNDKIAQIGFIREALESGGVAWLNVGWYQPSPRGGVWRRHGGHWLTVVGMDVDAGGNPAPGVLAIHDPAPWSGDTLVTHFARFRPIGDGWLSTEAGPFRADGYQALDGILVKHDGDVAIVDGAVVLVP
ncbi:MAG: hypothetical protein KC776_32505 [Myxococcales bacterium]|nr:hypothetical protein [Myxococcales bacterium]MCB9581216.1 hypothetical protein [Polyangiaceae bacterium]